MQMSRQLLSRVPECAWPSPRQINLMANWSSQELPQLHGQGGNQSLGRMERGVGLGVGMGVVWGGPGGVGGARAGVGVTECQLTIVAKLLVEVRRWLLCCFNLPFSAGIHSSVLDGICTLREAHMRSTPSLKSFLQC